jgi:quinol monooxygenase YgiN
MSVLTLVEVNVKPECVNEFKAYMVEIFPGTRAFKGCRGIQLQVNQDEPTNMIAVEEWETREDHQKYATWRAETGSVDRIMSMANGPLTIRYFDKTDA